MNKTVHCIHKIIEITVFDWSTNENNFLTFYNALQRI